MLCTIGIERRVRTVSRRRNKPQQHLAVRGESIPDRPSTEMWEALISAWRRMNESEPWNWMNEFQLIGVEDPFTGMLGIGRFFGQRKEDVPGFELMFGPRGLSGQVMIWNRPDMDPAERATVQSSVIATTANRSALERWEIEGIRPLGLKFNGEWPFFRTQLPGFYPRPLDQSHASTLLFALDISLEVAMRAKADPNIVRTLRDMTEPIYLMKGTIEGDEIVWRPGTCKVPPLTASVSMLPEAIIDGFRKELDKRPRGNGTWYLGCPIMLNIVIEDHPGRPMVPRTMVFIDMSDHRMVMIRPFGKDMDVLMPLAIVDGLIAGNEIPRRVLVTDDFTEALVTDILPRLGVEVKREKSLPDEELMARVAAADLEKKVLDENEGKGAEGRKKRYTHTANNK